MARVRIISPTGQPGSIEEAELEGALAQGFRLPTTEETEAFALQQQYGDQEIRTGAEGAARGFSFGLSDPLMEGFGVPTEDLAGRKKANPDAALAGEIGGTIASVATPGGPGNLVAKVGLGAERLVAKGAAGLGRKILAKGVGGAVEGAAFGAGSAVSESTLKGTPLEADMLMAHVGLGTLLGAGGNAVIGAAGAGIKATAKAGVEALGEGGFQQTMRDFARNRALKAVGFMKGDLNKLELERQAQIADDLLANGVIKPGQRADQILQSVKAAKVEAGKANGRILQQVDDELAAQGKAFDAKGAFAQIRKEILPAFDDPAFVSQKKKLEKLIAGYEKKAEKGPITFTQARVWKTNLQKLISKFKDTPIAQQANKDLQRAIDDQIEAQLGKVAGENVLKNYQEAKRLYGSYSEAMKVGKKAVGGIVGNRFISLTDHILGSGGALLAGGPAGIIVGGAAALANKILRERGSSALAIAADRLAKQNTISGALESVLKRMETGTTKVLTVAGRSAKGVGTPAGVNALLESTVPSSAIAGDDHGGDRKESIAAHVNELAELTANPALLTQRLSRATSRLTDLDPALGPALAAKATKAVEFLNVVAPKPPPGTMLKAFDGDAQWTPSDAEASRFERHLNTVSDPLAIYEDLAAGTVTREAVEGLQAVYPELYSDIQRRLLEQLGSLEEQLPYPKRLALAELFDVPVDAALQPDMLATLQATFLQQQAGPKGSPPSMRPPSVAQDSASRMDRLAAR